LRTIPLSPRAKKDVDEAHRLQQRREQALQTIDFIGRVLSLMTRLAAPRMLAHVPSEEMGEGRAQALQHVAEYLAMVERTKTGAFGDVDGRIARTEEATRRVQSLLETWSFSGGAPPLLVQAARDFHTAFYGISEPPGGWDRYDATDEETT
jgi:plasmid stabilization system protein ParE